VKPTEGPPGELLGGPFRSRAHTGWGSILQSRRLFIAAVRSAATYLGVSLYVLIVGPPGMLLAILFRWKWLLYALGHAGVRLGLALSGIRFRVAGGERIPLNRAAVFCANHQSNVDPPVLFEALHPRMHILYKHEIDRVPILARAFRLGGFIPIDRRNKGAAMRSIEAGARSIRSGNSFLIFPEGTRSRADELLPFKKGGFVMAIKAQAPIVPVAVQGGRAAMRKGSWIIQPVTVSIRVGQPIETAGRSPVRREELILRVRREIETLLAAGPI
jgi:1-acyl-sn-glycerol-3-phosphate acyltransferase